jgi:addiction module HigA family antidote
VLKDLYLEPLDMSAAALAARLELPHLVIARLIAGEAAMSADMAVRLGRFFSNAAEYWMNIQRDYDLHRARRRVVTSRIVPLKGE